MMSEKYRLFVQLSVEYSSGVSRFEKLVHRNENIHCSLVSGKATPLQVGQWVMLDMTGTRVTC
jgi:hypothetical protein